MSHLLKYILFAFAFIAATGRFRELQSSGEGYQVVDSAVFDNPVFGYTIHLPNNVKKHPLSTDYIFVGTGIESIPIDFDLIVILPDMVSLSERIKRWQSKKLNIERINATTIYIKTLSGKAKSSVQIVRHNAENGVSYCIFHIRGIDDWGNDERHLPHSIAKQMIATISTSKPPASISARTHLLEVHKKYWSTHDFQSIEDSTYIHPKVYDDGWGVPNLKGNTKGKRDRILRCMAEVF